MAYLRRVVRFLAEAFALTGWRGGARESPPCRGCLRPLAPPEHIYCDACADEEIRRRIGTLDPGEAVGWARNVALRDQELALASALQAVLLLHLTGGSLAPVTAMVQPLESGEAVN